MDSPCVSFMIGVVQQRPGGVIVITVGVLPSRRWLLLSALFSVGIATFGVAPSFAQNYPERPIRFIVPYGPGTATDGLARLLGESVSRQLGQQVVVENMAGANGQLGASNVARAEPDGYTVLITTNTTHASNPSLVKNLAYDPVEDFEPVTMLGSTPLALVVKPSLPAQSVAELIAYAEENPESLTFGAANASARIAVELLNTLAGIDIMYVPYNSSPQAMTDLLGGEIDMMFSDVTTTLSAARDGSVRALAVSTAKRTPLAPDLPTMREAGLADYDLSAWFAAFVPAETSPEIVNILNTAFIAAENEPAMEEGLLRLGLEPQTSTPEELAAFVQSETEKWAQMTEAAGIEPE